MTSNMNFNTGRKASLKFLKLFLLPEQALYQIPLSSQQKTI